MEKYSRNEIILMAICFTAILGIIDYATGYEVSLSVFYFGPVAFSAWYAGRRSGIMVSLLASLVWLNADLGAGHLYGHWSIPFWNSILRFSFLAFNALLMDAFHRQLESANLLARLDPLTGILNSRAFNIELEKAIDVHQQDEPFTLVYTDLDNFKQINDTYGHLEGDNKLCEVVNVLVASARSTDVVARVGGDEFALLLPKTDHRGAKVMLTKLRKHLADINLDSAKITCSLGAVTFLKPPHNSSQAMQLADKLMYASKRQGKDRVNFGIFDGEFSIKHAEHDYVPQMRRN